MDDHNPAFTARFRICEDGETFLFSCSLCGREYAVRPRPGPGKPLERAKEEARRHFNWCRHCGEWVCDGHFNENRGLCIRCAPRLCVRCGAFVPPGDQFCRPCGAAQFELQT